VSRTYNNLTPEFLDSCPAKPEVWRKMLFSLAFFHAVVQVSEISEGWAVLAWQKYMRCS
jgi:hypothetical protein